MRAGKACASWDPPYVLRSIPTRRGEDIMGDVVEIHAVRSIPARRGKTRPGRCSELAHGINPHAQGKDRQ